MNEGEFQAHTKRIEQLIEQAGGLADESARTTALELVQSLMDLHGAVLSRIVEVLEESGEAGRASLSKLGRDPLVCGLLVLYGVHPVPLERRVATAVEAAQPRLRKLGGTVELLDVADATVRVKVEATGHSCGSSADALGNIVQGAILEAAPEILEVMIEPVASTVSGFVPLNLIQPATRKEGSYEKSTA